MGEVEGWYIIGPRRDRASVANDRARERTLHDLP
jgi:hypothetical protein